MLTAKVLELKKELLDKRARGKKNRDAKKKLEVIKTKLVDIVREKEVKVKVIK